METINRELITREQYALLLFNGEQFQKNPDFDPKPVIKLFTYGNAVWLIASVDPKNGNLAYGLCDLGVGFPEIGSVSIEELKLYKGPHGNQVGRDLDWVPKKTLSEYASEARQHRQIIA